MTDPPSQNTHSWVRKQNFYPLTNGNHNLLIYLWQVVKFQPGWAGTQLFGPNVWSTSPPVIGCLSNHVHGDDGNKSPTNLHIWQWKTVFLHALHVHISFFDILRTFSFFLRREMTFFCSCVDDVSIWWQMLVFVFLCPKRWFQFNSRIVKRHFSSIMTLNNWKMIAEPRSYISIQTTF